MICKRFNGESAFPVGLEMSDPDGGNPWVGVELRHSLAEMGDAGGPYLGCFRSHTLNKMGGSLVVLLAPGALRGAPVLPFDQGGIDSAVV